MQSSIELFNIEYKEDIVNDIYCLQDKDNVFCVFYSVHEILCLAYSTIDYSIILFDVINKIKIVEIKNAHNAYIIEFRHFLDKNDKYNNRDLILSCSYEDRNIKIWDFNHVECIFNIIPYSKGIINSSCFLYDNKTNEILIITSNLNNTHSMIKDSIKVFNLQEKEIKEIKDSENEVIFIVSFYDDKYNKNYIISANKSLVISYDYEENKVYQRYINNNSVYDCTSIIIYNVNNNNISNNINNKVNLMCSTGDGFIKIWDFHLSELLNIIKINEGYIFSICLLKDKYLFSGGKYYKNEIIKKEDEKSNFKIIHLNGETTCKLIEHKIYGNCLITKSLNSDGPLKLWKIYK